MRATDIAVASGNYTNFLHHFRVVSLAKIDHSEVDRSDYIIEEFGNLRDELGAIRTAVAAIAESQSRADLDAQKAAQRLISEASALKSALESFRNTNPNTAENALLRYARGDGQANPLVAGPGIGGINRIFGNQENSLPKNALMPEVGKGPTDNTAKPKSPGQKTDK